MNENQQNQPVQDPGEVLLIDKPLTWTSFDVVKKLKYAGNFKKIGHAGTLDPLATGLLILCTGKMTKQIDSFQAQEKEYSGTLVLGKTTPSIDLETEFDGEYPTEHITEEIMQNALVQLTGQYCKFHRFILRFLLEENVCTNWQEKEKRKKISKSNRERSKSRNLKLIAQSSQRFIFELSAQKVLTFAVWYAILD
jgi:hypothetical protein